MNFSGCERKSILSNLNVKVNFTRTEFTVPKAKTYTISDLTGMYDISARSIRFYEEKGLLSPQRTSGNQRRYTANDCQRLKWILRGKRFGYSLSEVSKMLEMVDSKTNAVDRIKMALEYGEQKLDDIENQIQELEIMQKEMKDLKEKLQLRLERLTVNE